jgi:multidrug efflux pump subunit AcrA (membrane-fusion protein)
VRFRRQALRQLEAPEQLDEVVRLTSIPGWLTTVALAVAVVSAGVWSVSATVSRVVQAAGILIHSNGVSGVDATAGGQIVKVWGAVNQRVAKGTPLYSIEGQNGQLSIVNAPWDAYVVSWLVTEGQLLQPGTRIADLERLDTPGDALQAVVFVPASAAPLLQPGNAVDVVAEAVPSTVFGTLRGSVASVGAFPETEDSLRAFLGGGADVRRLLGSGTVIRVTVPLVTDPKSPSGLRWSKTAPPFQLNSESAITARFTIATEHPIDWLVGR